MRRTLRRTQLHLAVLALLFSGAAFAQAQIYPIYAHTASGHYYPMAYAVDGNPWTYWLAGAGAPQWIQIDLGAEKKLSKIELLTAQTPAGYTVHEIHGRAASGAWVSYFGAFSQYTYDNQWLSMPITSSIPVRYLFIYTTSSPSWVAWREVKVFEAVPAFIENWTTRPCITKIGASSDVFSPANFTDYVPDPSACTSTGNRYYITPQSIAYSTYSICGAESEPETRRNCTAVTGTNELKLRGTNTTGTFSTSLEGIALISEKQFSSSDHLIITTSAYFVCTSTKVVNNKYEACFLGIGLYNGEGDYKNVMLYHSENQILTTLGYSKMELEGGVLKRKEYWEPPIRRPIQSASPAAEPPDDPTREIKLQLEFNPATNETIVHVNGLEVAKTTAPGGFSGNPRLAIHVSSSGPAISGQPDVTSAVRLKPIIVEKRN